MHLCVVLNRNLFEQSAHMMYMARNAVGLAQANPSAQIDLIYPISKSQGSLEKYDLSHPANLKLHPLLAIRKESGDIGLTVNSIYFHRVFGFLKKAQPDFVLSGSFHKLLDFLLRRKAKLPRTQFIYEIHELCCLKDKPKAKEIAEEYRLLQACDKLLTTTKAMHNILADEKIEAAHIPLACAYDWQNFPKAPTNNNPQKHFALAYLGSTYTGQGIDWLTQNWPKDDPTLQLHIAGTGSEKFADAANIFAYPRQPIEQLAKNLLPRIDALVIPALSQGRMPYVAFTKSYDYLAMRRPILMADLPSITEVIRPAQEGIAFSTGNFSSFLEALQVLRESSTLRQTLAAAATARARELTFSQRMHSIWAMLDPHHQASGTPKQTSQNASEAPLLTQKVDPAAPEAL